LPSLGGTPVGLKGVLDRDACEALHNFETRLLADPEVVEERFREGSVPRDSYFDKKMRTNRSEYLKFLQMCSVCGILRGSRRRRGSITPFCVKKKGGMQRLVLDCRLVNAYFKDSPFTEIAAAESLASVETEVDQEVYLASGDIKACFYQCGIDEDLSEWFCLPSVSGDEARAVGVSTYDDGAPLPAGAAAVNLSMAVLPMGFSWAFWFVQRLHLEILKRADIPTERIALSHWPFPSQQDGPVEVPYCDNVTVLGVDKVAVTRARDSVIVAFRAAGFEMHEISETERQAIVLGTEAGGKQPSSRRDGSKGLMVKGSLQWLAKGPICTGRQVEVIVGHYIAACISNRAGLSPPGPSTTSSATVIVCQPACGLRSVTNAPS
jgi:hypothetical protein